MQKFLLMMSLLLSSPVWAEEAPVVETENVDSVMTDTQEISAPTASEQQEAVEEIDPLAPEVLEETNEEKQQEIFAKRGLPLCNDEDLLRTINNLLQEYNDQNPAETLYAKRQRILQLRHVQNYEEEAVAGFPSAENVNVADKLLMTKINEGLNDDEIRLCKSKKIENSRFKPIYVIIYPDKSEQIQVSVLNFKEDGSGEVNTIWGE